MQHLILEDPPAPGEAMELPLRFHHYLVEVRRLKQGDTVNYTDGAACRGVAEVVSVQPDSVTVRIVSSEAASPAPDAPPGVGPLEVYLPLLKGKGFDRALRAVTELGADRIIPVLTERCVSRPDGNRERWGAILREACQQCGRVAVPDLAAIHTLAQVVQLQVVQLQVAPGTQEAVSQSPPWYVFHETAQGVLEPLSEFAAVPPLPGGLTVFPPPWRVLTGPEGGLTEEEVQALRVAGWRIRRLSLPVLRAVTAAPAVVAIVQHLRTHYTAGPN